MEIYKYYKITSRKSKQLTKFLHNDQKHEANVETVEIVFRHSNIGQVVNNLTIQDLKDLRKIVRKSIKELTK